MKQIRVIYNLTVSNYPNKKPILWCFSARNITLEGTGDLNPASASRYMYICSVLCLARTDFNSRLSSTDGEHFSSFVCNTMIYCPIHKSCLAPLWSHFIFLDSLTSTMDEKLLLWILNPSLPTSMHCTDLSFLTYRQPRCSVRFFNSFALHWLLILQILPTSVHCTEA